MQNVSAMLPDLGPLFMIGLPGLRLDDSTLRLIDKCHLNNFILFKRNVRGREQLRQLCSELRRACAEQGLPAPLIAIDQEGGGVSRLPPPFTQFPAARELADSADAAYKLLDYARTCTQELLDVGINMNLAPVLDVCEAGKGYFMERRTLGDDPARVAKLGRLIITEMQGNGQGHGIAACAKHFPGLGTAVVDPHRRLPRVDQSLDRLHAVDLVPFKEAITAGVAAIMTSHSTYPGLHPEEQETPATLSKTILAGLLRLELKFEGLIITDDLEMGAIENEGPLEQAALDALQAGADLLLICHDHDKIIKTFNTITAAYTDGKISPERLAASLNRLAATRRKFLTP